MSSPPPWTLGLRRCWPGRKLLERGPVLVVKSRSPVWVWERAGRGHDFSVGAAPGGVHGPVAAPGGWLVAPCLGPCSDLLDPEAPISPGVRAHRSRGAWAVCSGGGGRRVSRGSWEGFGRRLGGWGADDGDPGDVRSFGVVSGQVSSAGFPEGEGPSAPPAHLSQATPGSSARPGIT